VQLVLNGRGQLARAGLLKQGMGGLAQGAAGLHEGVNGALDGVAA
jgi:hypothetical protein